MSPRSTNRSKRPATVWQRSLHRALRVVVPVPVRREFGLVGEFDLLEFAVLEGLQCEPRSPHCGRDQPLAVRGFMDDSRIGESLCGGKVPSVVDAAAVAVPEAGLGEHVGQLCGCEGVGVDDAAGHGGDARGLLEAAVWGEEVGHGDRTVGVGGRGVKSGAPHPLMVEGGWGVSGRLPRPPEQIRKVVQDAGGPEIRLPAKRNRPRTRGDLIGHIVETSLVL